MSPDEALQERSRALARGGTRLSHFSCAVGDTVKWKGQDGSTKSSFLALALGKNCTPRAGIELGSRHREPHAPAWRDGRRRKPHADFPGAELEPMEMTLLSNRSRINIFSSLPTTR